MLKIFRKSFDILKNNLIFIQPLLLCLLMVITAISFLLTRNLMFVPKIILITSITLFIIAFSAGWFYINKNGLISYNETDTKDEMTLKSIMNFRKFFEGIGSEFIRTLLSSILLFIIYAIVSWGIFELCLGILGEPKIIYELPELAKAASQAEILNLLNEITTIDKIIFTAWVLIFNIASSILNFLVLLYFAVLNLEKFNIFKTLWTSISFFFKNIIGSIAIIIVSFALYAVLNILSVLLGTNSLSFVILIIMFTIYFNYYLILVFCFYYDKTKNNSNNRTEFIG